MAIVKQYDKRVGITYVYESKSYRDPITKQPRATRKLIGKIDPKTGTLIPTRTKEITEKNLIKQINYIKTMKHTTFGATRFLDILSNKLNVTRTLKNTFPDLYKYILSLSYYMIIEENSSLRKFEKWQLNNETKSDIVLKSQMISDIFSSINNDNIARFFKLFAQNMDEKETLAYDTTSISSYSKAIEIVKYGKNKEDDKLAQINLLMLYGQESNLPYYYKILPGNITDVKTVTNLIKDLENLDFPNVNLVMDRGFHSSENINNLLLSNRKFLLGIKNHTNFAKNVRKSIKNISNYDNFINDEKLYSQTVKINWEFSNKTLSNMGLTDYDNTLYVHVYYSDDKFSSEKTEFYSLLKELENDLKNNKHSEQHKNLYEKYFILKDNKYIINKENVDDKINSLGYFFLASNYIKNNTKALNIYRNKDLVEKAFHNIKDRLNMRRTRVSSSINLESKMFVTYISLILVSHIKKVMEQEKLFKEYTMSDLIDQFETIKLIRTKDNLKIVSEITKKQINILNKFSISEKEFKKV